MRCTDNQPLDLQWPDNKWLEVLKLFFLFLEAIASLVVTFSLSQSLTQSLRFFGHLINISHIPVTYQSHASHMPVTCRSHDSHMSVTCQSHVSHMSVTCQSHASHMPVTCQSHASHMPVTCQSYASHMPVTCQSHVSHMQVTCKSHASHMSVTCQSHVSHMSVTCHSHVSHMSVICQSHVSHMPVTCNHMPFTCQYMINTWWKSSLNTDMIESKHYGGPKKIVFKYGFFVFNDRLGHTVSTKQTENWSEFVGLFNIYIQPPKYICPTAYHINRTRYDTQCK
jgi:hypothetical protein